MRKYQGKGEQSCEVAVLWIDWYPYHLARFAGLNSTPLLAGKVVGLEMVSGVGVHAGLRFREELPEGLPIETLLPGVSWRDASKVSLAVAVWRRLNELRPKVVLVPGYYTLPAIAAALWARFHGRSSVLMSETTAFDHRRVRAREWMKKLLIRALFQWAVTGGKAHVRYLRQFGFPRRRIVGCYDVVDNDVISRGVAEAQASGCHDRTSQPSFLFVGRLAEEKNVAGLLRSWVAYRDAGGTWPLVLAGDGPLRLELEELAHRSRWGHEVTFPGLKSLRELIPFYAAAGCFVLPSTREPWGLVVNEAMAAGVPVLVSRRCGCREDLVAEGENGFSFDPGNEVSLSALLARMEGLAPAERTAMGRRSEEIISRYTPRGFGRAIASIARGSDPAGKLHLISEVAQ